MKQKTDQVEFISKREHQRKLNYMIYAVFFILVIGLPLVFSIGYYSAQAQGSTPVFEHPADSYSYLIWKDGSTYYAKSGSTGAIDYYGTDKTTVYNNVLTALSLGGTIYFKDIPIPSISTLRSNILLIEDNYGNVTYYKGRTYLFYCAVSGAGTIENIALAVSERTIDDVTHEGVSYWTKKGIVLPYTQGWEGTRTVEPCILYEGSPQLITDAINVFKMWYRGNGGSSSAIGYAESKDGVTWTKYSGNPVIATPHAYPFITKQSGTYYMYSANLTTGNFELHTSSNGVSWTFNATVLQTNPTGWDYTFGNPGGIFVEGSTWNMIYEAKAQGSQIWKFGLATSSDGINWNKYGGNPVLDLDPETVGGASEINKVGGTYYMYFHESDTGAGVITEIHRMQSADLITWTNDVLVLPQTFPCESHQTADATVFSTIYNYKLPLDTD